jgi:hypothetical protein
MSITSQPAATAEAAAAMPAGPAPTIAILPISTEPFLQAHGHARLGESDAGPRVWPFIDYAAALPAHPDAAKDATGLARFRFPERQVASGHYSRCYGLAGQEVDRAISEEECALRHVSTAFMRNESPCASGDSLLLARIISARSS